MENHPAIHMDGAISEDLLKKLAYNEKMAELGRISAGVVHELNAPLSVISSASQMILRETDIPEFVREMVGRIGIEAQRLSQLTRGLLNFSSHDESPSEVDINLAAGFVLDFLAYEAARRSVTIVRQLDFRLPVLEINANQLKQVLFNLVMNALQAMELNGGVLTVETLAHSDNEISIIISDNGCGIPKDNLSRIFQPYFTTKQPGEGTGLGLFLSKKLVENMGGRVEVFSKVGSGTSFTLTMAVEKEGSILK